MSDDKFTTGPWNSHIRGMTGADGETRRKCFIEKGGVALAQFQKCVNEVIDSILDKMEEKENADFRHAGLRP